ncbi:MAG: hypothetical protein U5L04_10555 [Trueperaceae bacterium]|nr:hypothetical protein [Trueperaceae bacterium]
MADRDLQAEFDQLKNDIADLQKDLKSLGKSGNDAANDAVSAARERLEEETQHLIDRLQGTAGEMRGRGEKVVSDVEDQIGDKPITTLLASFGIGFVVGWLLSRK